ncbi:MAG: hypothetical protein D6830_04115 [Ignavibacteria bacterium]|nr:MAG: hypothetical protein D6830_04115 [Ignavibacteria bacterium]
MKKLLIIFLFSCSASWAQSVSANPTRPSASDNAYITANKYLEMEFGLSTSEAGWSLPLLFKSSVFRNTEVGFFMNGLANYNSSDETSDLGNPGLQIKHKLIDREFFASAFVAKTEIVKNASTIFTFYDASSFQFEYFQMDVTLGVNFYQTSSKFNNSYFYAAAISPKLNSKFGVFVEIFGDYTSNQNNLYFDGGISYALFPTIVFDASYTPENKTTGAPSVFQLGVTTTLYKIF